MEVLALDKVQTISDVITNSSSELFVIDKSSGGVEEIDKALSSIITGYQTPFVFNMKDYSNWIYNYDVKLEELEASKEDAGDEYYVDEDILKELDEMRESPYYTINDWFLNKRDEEGCRNLIREELYYFLKFYNAFEILGYPIDVRIIYRELYTSFITQYNSIFKESIQTWDINREKLNIFLDKFIDRIGMEFLLCIISEPFVQDLEGKIIVISEGENTIEFINKNEDPGEPCAVEVIEKLFNAERFHLG